jgi:hypothetical protein
MLRRLLAPFILLSILGGGSAARVGYRTYDPYYRDYHVWTDAELPHYHVWITESHHRNMEYRRLRRQDREAYWRWRHDHP